MPTASSGPIQPFQDGHGYGNTGSGLQWFYEGTDGTTWIRNHGPLGLQSTYGCRFTIPTSIYNLWQAGTGVSLAEWSVKVTHNGAAAGPVVGDVIIAPDQAAFANNSTNGPWPQHDAIDALPANYPKVEWSFAANQPVGTVFVSPDLSAGLDQALGDAVYNGVDGYDIVMLWQSTNTANVFYRVESMENAGNSPGTLNFDYDAPATNANVTPDAATAAATVGLGSYLQWLDVNYDRDNSRTGNNFRRYVDVYEPIGMAIPYDDSAGRRMGVYIHGGAYFEGDEDTITWQHRTAMLSRGWTVAAVSYSLSDQDTANNDNDYSHPMAIQDLGMALTYLTDSDGNNSPSGPPVPIEPIDPEWIVLEAYSAGGHLALGYALTYDDDTTHQWQYTGDPDGIARRGAEPDTNPDFRFTQGRTNQPRPRALYLWDPPVDLGVTVAFNNALYGAVQAFYGANGDGDWGATGAGWAEHEADYNRLITGEVTSSPDNMWAGKGRGWKLHGVPIGYVEARWGDGRWAPPIRNYGDPGETVNYNAGIKALEDALDVINYPTNTTGTGAYQAGIRWWLGSAGLNVDGGLSHWQAVPYTTIPSFPHDVVYLYDNYSDAWAWGTWHEWLENSNVVYELPAASASATAPTPSVSTGFVWESTVADADETLFVAPAYNINGSLISGAIYVDDDPAPVPANGQWLRHELASGGAAEYALCSSFGHDVGTPYVHGRTYVRFDTVPAQDCYVCVLNDTNGDTFASVGYLPGTGLVLVPGTGTSDTLVASITADTTYRIEWRIDQNATPWATVQTQLFVGESVTPLADETVACEVARLNFDAYVFGATSTFVQTTTVWTAAHAMDADGWLGPAGAGSLDANATPTVASASATAPTPTVTGQTNATADPTVATATATATDPTVTGQTNTTADPTVATATATAPTPTATGESNATADPTTATANASAPDPTVGAVSDASADPTTATAAATAPTPTVTGQTNTTADPTVASAVAIAPTASVSTDSNTAADPDPGYAVATAPTPTVTGETNATASPTVATATASSPTPNVTGTFNAAADANTAAATATGVDPSVSTDSNTAADPTVASATGTAPTPTVTGETNATADANTATATASAPAPTVTGQTNTTTDANTATATATGINPEVATDSETPVNPDPAVATADAPTPTVTGQTNTVADAGPGAASASAPTPTVDATWHATADPTVASATGTAPDPLVTATSDASVTPTVASAGTIAVAPEVATDGETPVNPDAAIAAATAPTPTVTGVSNAEADPTVATASASAASADVTADSSNTADPTVATATASAPAPTVGATWDATVAPTAAGSVATAPTVAVLIEQDAAALLGAATATAATGTVTVLAGEFFGYRTPDTVRRPDFTQSGYRKVSK